MQMTWLHLSSLLFASLSLFWSKKVPIFILHNSHEKIRWLFCNTFPFYFRVLRLRKESVLTSTLNALPRPVKVFVRYLNMQQELHWWFQRRRSPRVALFCKKNIKKIKKMSLSLMVSQHITFLFYFLYLYPLFIYKSFLFLYLHMHTQTQARITDSHK